MKIAVCGLALLMACGCSGRADRLAGGSLGSATELGVLGSALSLGAVQTRDAILRIDSTSRGLRYTVTSADGRILSASLTAAQLAQRHPALHRLAERATAAGGLDARLDLPQRTLADDRTVPLGEIAAPNRTRR